MKRSWIFLLIATALPAIPSRASQADWGRKPLAFEENRGQTDGRVKFLSRGQGYGLFLTPDEAVLALQGETLRLRWEGAAASPRVSGEGEMPGKSHYFVGNNPSRWRTGIPSYGKVRYQGVYPGIDLVFYGNPRQLEYDFVLAPGADPRKIRLAVSGADRMEIDPAGDLVLHLGGEEVRLKRPLSYQETDGVRREVASAFRRIGEGRIGFAVGEHDPTRSLVIDPVLVYSTYLGGSRTDLVNSIAADAAGSAYVAGATSSPDFPGSRTPLNVSAFVTKLDPAGAFVYSAFLDGSGYESGLAVALDATGNVYLTGQTTSSDFPRLVSLSPPPSSLNSEVFVSKLDPSGARLLYSTTFGGSEGDLGFGLAVDAQGHAYVAGDTQSSDFPTVHALWPFPNSFHDAFVAKLSPDGSQLVFSTYLGGSSLDSARGVALDSAGNPHVTGWTSSPNFPVLNALQGWKGSTDAFVIKLVPAGTSVIYSTYLGGSDADYGYSIASDTGGNVHVSGYTFSNDFPLRNPWQPALAGNSDAFMARLSPAGSLLGSTYLGGSDSDVAYGIAVDAAGSSWLTGVTYSADFPLRDPLRTSCHPLSGTRCERYDAFVAKLALQGSELLFSTYLGGTLEDRVHPVNPGQDAAMDIAVDPTGSAYIGGYTFSRDFPTVNAFQSALRGSADGFVTRISLNQPPVCSAASASPATLWPPNGKLVPISIGGVTDPDGDPVTLKVTGVRQDEPRQGTSNASGIGTATVQLRADREGGGDGRVYRITFEASDGNGGVCTGTVTVCVPRDQGQGRTCSDGGGLFASAP